VLYILLCGYPPFYSESNAELFDQITKGQLEFHSPYWNDISVDAKDLIKKLLTVDPKQRITIEEAREHPWFMN